jgi:hypothetical protein
MEFGGFIFLGIVVNLVLSFIVASTAREKGLNFGAFFLLSFLASFLVGILVVIATPKVENAAGSGTGSASSGLLKCPFCAEMVKSEALVCRFCGRDIHEQLIAQAEAISEEARRSAKAFDDEQKRIAAESEDARIFKEAKRNVFFRKRSTIIGAVAIVTVALSAVSFAIVAYISGQNDWSKGLDKCVGSLPSDTTVVVSPNANSLVISSKSRLTGMYLNCIGQEFSLVPNAKPLGEFVQEDKTAGDANGSKLIEYGNLKVLLEKRNYPDPFVTVITR